MACRPVRVPGPDCVTGSDEPLTVCSLQSSCPGRGTPPKAPTTHADRAGQGAVGARADVVWPIMIIDGVGPAALQTPNPHLAEF